MVTRSTPYVSARKFILAVTLWLLLASTTWAQTPSASPTLSDTSVEVLKQRLDEVQQKLQDAPERDVSHGLPGPDEPPSSLDSLRRYDVALRRLITLKERQSRLQANLDTVAQQLEQVTSKGLSEQKPYTVELLDSLQTELDLVSEKNKAANLAHTAAQTSMELESDQLESYQALRRRLLDKLQSNPTDVDLRRQLDNVETAITTSETSMELARVEMKTSELELELGQKKGDLLRIKIKLVEDEFHFSKSTLDSQYNNLEDARSGLTDSLKTQRKAEELSQERLTKLHTDDIDDQLQREEIQARAEWVQTHQRRERLLEEQLEYNLIRRDLWERRYLVYAGQAKASYEEWLNSARGLLVRLGNNRDVLNSELAQIRTQLSELVTGSDAGTGNLDQWKDLTVQALVNRQKVLEETLRYLLETESLAKRLLAELSQTSSERPFSQQFAAGWATFKNFWNIELYTLGDSSVTVGKFTVAIIVLVLGLALVGRLSRLANRKIFAVLPFEENVRSNLERLSRYLLTLLVFLFSLHVVNIPLTIFTFLGGTLAIAVGFGAQNILNNFISGLILMVERPVRVGDMVQVDDTMGTVEEIGARSTRIRVPTGIHVILPNSSLLENKVVNWTLRDQKIRTKVSVGVAYGSPIDKVMELITEAVASVEEIQKFPPPVVTFDDFADSSLNFTVHFWVHFTSPMDRDKVNTKVRLNIDHLFAENNISIPFPQRDLNFNSPVPVRIVTDSKEQET